MKWSGLFDLALKGGFITSPSMGYYEMPDDYKSFVKTDKFRKSAIENDSAFWKKMLDVEAFKEYINDKYMLDGNMMVEEND